MTITQTNQPSVAVKPKGGGAMPPELEKRIVSDFGSVEKFKEDFIQATELKTSFVESMQWKTIRQSIVSSLSMKQSEKTCTRS